MTGNLFRVGVLGAGGMAQEHLAAWRELGADLRVFSPRTGPELAARFEIQAAGSVSELLAGADVVDICTPTTTHLELGRAAVVAGVPIICEKPLARTASDAAMLAGEAEQAGVPLFPAHVVRYFPAYASAHHAVTAGELGAVTGAEFSRVGTFPGSGTWFASRAASGGVIMDLLIHDLDQARWLVGEISSVAAELDPLPVGDQVPEGVSARITLRHDSGAVSVVRGRWGPPGTPFRTTFRLDGERGELDHDSLPGAADAERGWIPAAQDGFSPYLAQLRELTVAIREGRPARVSAADGVAAVALAEAALTAADVGRPVPIIR